MKKKWLKRSNAILLSMIMALSLFPGMNGTIPTVQAAENTSPESAYHVVGGGLFLMSYHLSDIVERKDKAWRRPPMCRHADCKVIGSSWFLFKAKKRRL